MPLKPLRPCLSQGCNQLTRDGLCEAHKQQKAKIKREQNKNDESAYERPEYYKNYKTARWQKLREIFLQQNPLCKDCEGVGDIQPATVCDHIVPHKGDMELFWDIDNLQGLCKHHHDLKTAIENGGWRQQIIYFPKYLKPSRIPLFIVCGSPGSGKSTFVNNNKQRKDLVIDLDEIISTISGREIYQADFDRYIKNAILYRNQLLYSLNKTKTYKRAWFITTAARLKHREFWRESLEPIKLFVLETPRDTCINRIKQDTRRKGKEEAYIKACRRWWDKYERSNLDTTLFKG
jgi:5-methylcytosine-specific restriction endonuclease McrA/predicted kinase